MSNAAPDAQVSARHSTAKLWHEGGRQEVETRYMLSTQGREAYPTSSTSAAMAESGSDGGMRTGGDHMSGIGDELTGESSSLSSASCRRHGDPQDVARQLGVLLLDGETRQSLTFARVLGRAGITIGVAAERRDSAPAYAFALLHQDRHPAAAQPISRCVRRRTRRIPRPPADRCSSSCIRRIDRGHPNTARRD